MNAQNITDKIKTYGKAIIIGGIMAAEALTIGLQYYNNAKLETELTQWKNKYNTQLLLEEQHNQKQLQHIPHYMRLNNQKDSLEQEYKKVREEYLLKERNWRREWISNGATGTGISQYDPDGVAQYLSPLKEKYNPILRSLEIQITRVTSDISNIIDSVNTK